MIQFCKITESAAFIIVDITYMKIGMFACPHWPQDEELPSLYVDRHLSPVQGTITAGTDLNLHVRTPIWAIRLI